MTRKTPLALAVAAALLLSGCGSDDPGTATPSSTAATTTSSSASSSPASETSTTSSSTSTSEESTTESTSDSSSESSTESGGDTGLDADTEAFFTTFCGTVSDYSDQFENFDPTSEMDTTSPETIRDSLADVLYPLASELTAAGDEIAAASPPTFEGGEDVQSAIVAAFADAGTAMTEKIDTFAATPAEGVEAAVTTVATDIQTVFSDFQAQLSAVDADVPADVEAGITEIPECANI